MAELTIIDGDWTHTRDKRLYSNIVGKNLLKRILDRFGIEILLQFGFKKAIVDRMVKKGLLGGEIDILAAIRNNRDNLTVKYLRRREFDLIQSTLKKYLPYGYLKPICMLSLFRTGSKTKHNKLFQMTYEELMFSKQRRLLDRQRLFDAFIFFIVELQEHKQRLTTDQFEILLTTDYASLVDSTSPAGQLFKYFSSFYLGQPKHLECKIQRKPGLSNIITEIYNQIRKEYLKQGIADIKSYCEKMSGGFKITYHNMQYVNYVLHNRRRVNNTTIPNIILQGIRSLSAKLSQQTKNEQLHII